MNALNILVSSSGRRVQLIDGFRRALAAEGLAGQVAAADASDLAPTLDIADRAFGVPPCSDAAFIGEMVRICRDNDVGLLIPTIDDELPLYARAAPAFASVGTHVAVSSLATIDVAADKIQTHAWLSEHGFPTVRQSTADDVLRRPASWHFPVLCKPVAGSMSKGVFIVRSRDQLERIPDPEQNLVQAIAPGVEYTVSTYVDLAGTCLAAVPRLRMQVRGGEVSKGLTVKLPKLEELASEVVEALPGPRGALNVQIFHDDTAGELNVIEINARFGGGDPLAWTSGADAPRWMIQEVTGRPTTHRTGWRGGMLMLRFDRAIYRDPEGHRHEA